MIAETLADDGTLVGAGWDILPLSLGLGAADGSVMCVALS
jgi:hypothetical protein